MSFAFSFAINGAITAQHRPPQENTGFNFVGCKITGVKSAILGRPWGAYARVVFAQTYMSSVILPTGWEDWNDPSRQRKIMRYGKNYYRNGSVASTEPIGEAER
ncbi:hypothetical protein FXO38_05567 [Capsicum annuum]|nr:hypothetical protein FXO37_29290 [Capsicum annuum]KAF3673620.1 hypothetical protein FXO38_05567 [Capsicum annuum]